METGINVRYRRVRVSESGQFPNVRIQAVSMACNHCENAWCQKVCPVQAIWKRDDGIVLIDQDRCVGCRECEKFCPYDVPQFNAQRKKMEKCTMCADRIDLKLK
ncbi:MAG: 4Fe-4S dicluster domain-containing protein, partial [Acidobacteriota bacterium]